MEHGKLLIQARMSGLIQKYIRKGNRCADPVLVNFLSRSLDIHRGAYIERDVPRAAFAAKHFRRRARWSWGWLGQ